MNTEILSALQKKKVKLIAVSKTKPIEQIMPLYDMGQRAFGENKVQELCDKFALMPKDIEWHMIGHLQRNKVKYIAPFIHLIHAVDSLDLLEEINKQALKHQRVIDCLLQFYIANESTKFGLTEDEAVALLTSEVFQGFENIRIVGVMGMATFTDNQQQIRGEFAHLKAIFERLKEKYFQDKPYFKEISMGMSDDYEIAIDEGSTMVRLGSLLFGKR
jgi:pyridoxal phosphate enzyme (YggS family)